MLAFSKDMIFSMSLTALFCIVLSQCFSRLGFLCSPHCLCERFGIVIYRLPSSLTRQLKTRAFFLIALPEPPCFSWLQRGISIVRHIRSIEHLSFLHNRRVQDLGVFFFEGIQKNHLKKS